MCPEPQNLHDSLHALHCDVRLSMFVLFRGLYYLALEGHLKWLHLLVNVTSKPTFSALERKSPRNSCMYKREIKLSQSESFFL